MEGIIGKQPSDIQITVVQMPVHHKKHAKGGQDSELHVYGVSLYLFPKSGSCIFHVRHRFLHLSYSSITFFVR